MNRRTLIHPFEDAGLGRAPFRFVGMENRVGPIKSHDHKTGITTEIGSPGQPMGSCDYCGQGIALCCHIKSSDGKRFIVGSDCVARTYGEKDPVALDTKRAIARHRRQRDAASKGRRIEAARATFERHRTLFEAEPHPNAYWAGKGQTLADSIDWFFKNAGTAGKLKMTRLVERRTQDLDQ